MRPAAEEPPEIEMGRLVPDFALADQNGHVIHLQDYRGQAVLLTFVYTRCPLPDYCPLMSKNFASLQERFGKAFAGRFHLITISFDPEHDTPEVLKRYAAVFTQDESTWTFATGTTRQVERVASQFGLVYLPEAGSFTHDLRTALISPEGRLIHVCAAMSGPHTKCSAGLGKSCNRNKNRLPLFPRTQFPNHYDWVHLTMKPPPRRSGRCGRRGTWCRCE
jgi:cytochrome oxidase Cu insertion factor (SCO1/SenC/PrrC family)